MNDLITKVEIISFRSIERISIPVKEINIFSGSNDIGKSNILKAINLFFNNQTDFLKSLKFEDDYNKVSRAKAALQRFHTVLNPASWPADNQACSSGGVEI